MILAPGKSCSVARTPHPWRMAAFRVPGQQLRQRPGFEQRHVASCAVARSSTQAGLVASSSTAVSDAAPLLELQRIALEAQMESEMWAHQITDHELRQAAARAQLDMCARQQARAKAALLGLKELLDDAKAVTRLQHARVFAESVYVCGRQRRGDEGSSSESQDEGAPPSGWQPLPAEQHLAQVQVEATLQLQQYEQRLKHMMQGVVAGKAAVEGLTSGLPALVGGGEAGGARAAVAGGGGNNIVPHRPKAPTTAQPQEGKESSP